MNKKFYITTSLAYTNAPPHIGFAQEVIQADVLARYHRFLEEDVLFLTGTDEHGAKIAKAARENNERPKEFCDRISQKFRKLKDILDLSNDDFIRTTDTIRHLPTVNKVWMKLKERGDIYKKKYKGFYCVGCEAFIPKRELIDGKCPVHKKKAEIVEEENYFFRLSRYAEQIKKIIETGQMKVIPEGRKREILSFIKKGVKDISVSRPKESVEWGIPIPDDNTQTIYVWIDALCNYISALDYAGNGEKFSKFWPADVHCIGKDILRFHALIWPAILLSLGLELPRIIFVRGFITVNGQKMSKSLGNVVSPFDLVKKYGSDAVRYFLLRNFSSTEGGDFTYEKFERIYNADLANGLGNFVARVITLAEKSKIKKQKSKIQIKNKKIKKEIDETRKRWQKALEDFKFNEALISIWNLISFCDRYIEKERPWEIKNQKGPYGVFSRAAKIKNQKVISDLLAVLTNIATMLQPFLPGTSERIFQQLKSKESKILFPKI